MEPARSTIDATTHMPLCPKCGRPMRFRRAVPRFAALPELRTYECTACTVTYTQAIEPGDTNDGTWMED